MHVLDSLIHSPWLAEMVWVSALIAALAYAVRSARRDGLDPRVAYWGGVFALGLGAWGSSLLGLYYYGTGGLSWAWLRLWSGGRAEYGGLLAGLLAIAVYLRIRRQPFLRYVDSITPAVALGIAIGRIGCFINGDDFGTRTQLPWGVSFPLGTGPKLYEIWHSGYYPVVWTNTKYRMIYMNMGHNDMDYEHKTNKQLSSTFASATQDQLIINSLLWLGKAQ